MLENYHEIKVHIDLDLLKVISFSTTLYRLSQTPVGALTDWQGIRKFPPWLENFFNLCVCNWAD